MREVARAYAIAEEEADQANDPALLGARELIIRLVDHRTWLGAAQPIHDALLARIGLYPYLSNSDLTGSDLFAFEAHRPLGSFGDDAVWHRDQARAYALLQDGKNVILSAPTSFGKSRVIDGLVAGGRFGKILIIVPTLALIDEARRRLSRLAGDDYKVITHISQAPAEKTIYVLTQERVLEMEELPDLDLFVIDEFYKLALDADADRARLLNQALYRLLKNDVQFYLLGPNIGGIGADTLEHLECVWIDSWDTTVAVDVHQVRKRGKKKRDRLVEICRECAERGEPTLIYCSGPDKVEKVGTWIAEAGIGQPAGDAVSAGAWLGENFHPGWRVAQSLARGVGIHHGQLPRAVGHFMVSAFDRGEINFLACTSTLIEGVNTKAKNVIIFDHTIGKKRPLDLFTFNNIRGRSGRLFSHVTGRVYLFKPAPDPPLEEIDFPILAQPADAPPELFIGMSDDDIRPASRERLQEALDAAPVSEATLKATPAVSIDDQLKLAAAITDAPADQAVLLSWSTAYPRNAQVKAVLDIVWDAIYEGDYAMPLGASSSKQLVKWLNLLERGTTRALMAGQVSYFGPEKVDETILRVLRFLRKGLAFEIPKWIMAVHALQRELLPRRALGAGDYTAYAARLENLFLPQPLGALDEYGVPAELSRKLASRLVREGDELDDVLRRLMELDLEDLTLTSFERRLLTDARTDLRLPAA